MDYLQTSIQYTIISNPVHHHLQSSTPSSPIQYTIISHPVHHHLPSSTPSSPIQYTIISNPVHHHLQSSTPSSPIQYTIISHPVHHHLQSSTPSSPIQYKTSYIQYTIISNPVHHHLQSTNPYALFLTETKIKPLDPSNSTVLLPRLKCPGYELFSSFFPNGGVCAFTRSDVQTLHLKQIHLSNPGFPLFWLKISLPHATKYICTLYRSPNSNNHQLLFDHLSKAIETITLQSPRSEIIVLGDFNIHNSDWLSYSSNVTNPAGREAEAFAIVNDLTQVISEPTRVPDRAGEKANPPDIFLTSTPSIYSPPTVSSPLGNSDHCLITLRHGFFPHLDRLAPQRVFHYNKADWDSLRIFYSSYPWSSGLSNDPSSLASFITDAILLGMDLSTPSSYKPGKNNSPKWFKSQ